MKKLFLPLIALLMVAGCQSKPVTGETIATGNGSYQSVSPGDLNVMLQDKDFLLINVHIPFAGDISGTDLSIPFDQIEQNLSRLPADKGAKIVLYCRSGRMSQIAAEKLVSMGYTNVWDLKGGMVSWEQAGYMIENLP